MISLAVYYSTYPTRVVGTFDTKGDLAAYRAKVLEHPTLKCDCEVQSIPFQDFAVPVVKINEACNWVEADLANKTLSSCRSLNLGGYCVTVRDACKKSAETIEWILGEFNNSVVSSTSLMHEASLKFSTNASLMSDFKVGELISASPKQTVKAWAAANMPRIVRLLGDVAIRGKAQTQKMRYLVDNTDDTFAQSCAAARPIVCRGSSTDDDDYALKEGDLPLNCTRNDTAPSCTIDKVANGVCNPACMSPECLFDGGDCANRDPSHKDKDLRQSFTLLDAFFTLDEYYLSEASDSDTKDYDSSWLDNTPNAYSNFTRRRCDDAERWSDTDLLPEDVDLWGSKFAGYDFSKLVSGLKRYKSDANWPTTEDGEKVEFRASKILGCDQYQKELKENMFEFYSVDEFKNFVKEMRTIAGADLGPVVPDNWTCDPSFYEAGDGCDCACGAWDPDCDDPSMSVFGCSQGGCINVDGLGTCEFDANYGYNKRRRLLDYGGDYVDEYGNVEWATVTKNIFDPSKEVYKTRGLDYLENFAAPLVLKHTNLDTAIDNLFVDVKELQLNYTKYFEACKPSSCTYTYMSASSLAGVIAVVIGLIGGINSQMNATFKFVYSVMRYVIVPKEAETEDTEGEAVETPATEGAQPSKSPV